jgi:CheY-like chemotaxis protein
VEAVSAGRPDVVICDVGLPDMDGFEVVRRIRAALPAPRPFTIALTGYTQPQDRAQALEAGFDAHLAKPPSFAELDRILAAVARRKGPPSTDSPR